MKKDFSLQRMSLKLYLCLSLLLSYYNTVDCMPAKGNQATCPKPSEVVLEQVLSSLLLSQINVVSYWYTCQAVRAYNLYDSMAAVVQYTPGQQNVSSVLQLVLECEEGSHWTGSEIQIITDSEELNNIVRVGPQTQCYKCVSTKPEKGPGSENSWNQSTWCLECSENCKSMGGGFCVSPSTYSCCPYFGKEDGLCVDECSTTVNSTSHCTDECEGHWSGDNCKNCTLVCLNGGRPEMTNCSECICPIGFTGKTCENVVPRPCDSNPCLNGGTCNAEGLDDFSCVCPSGWTGLNCDEEIDKCSESDYCKNGGECIHLDGDILACNCSGTEFIGPTCEEEKNEENECEKRPDHCHNSGTCVSNGESIKCECPPDYTGPRCEDKIDTECACLNGGTCELIEDAVVCFCPEMFKGPLCEHPDPCVPNPCLNGGLCSSNSGDYSKFICACTSDWTGETCDICMDNTGGSSECSPQPRQNLSVEDSDKPPIGLIMGIVFAVILGVLLVAALVVLVVLIYKRYERIQDETKAIGVDNNAFEGQKVMVNPVFITPDDLSIEESMKAKLSKQVSKN